MSRGFESLNKVKKGNGNAKAMERGGGKMVMIRKQN